MALDPPSEVVQFLQFIGVNWPSVNEDTVREVAGMIQEFADNLKNTHQDATSTIQNMGDAYQADSYDQLVQRWADMSSTHMTDLLNACHDVVAALHAAADYIVAMKISAIAELVGLAAAFVADQAAAVATFGLAEAAVVALDELASEAVDFLEQQLVQYIISEVIEAGFKALGPVIERAMDGFVFKAAASILDVPAAPSGASGSGYRIHPEMLRVHAATMRAHGETAAGHAQDLKARLATVSFA
jgi:uncharacterized protein YukE